MTNTIITNLGADLLPFTFTDHNGEVFASFRMNPADIKLANRLRNVDKKLAEIKERFSGKAETLDVLAEYNDAVEELFCYVLGYDVKESLFGFMSATAILRDGTRFYKKVLNVMVNAVGEEVEKRQKSMQKNISKYTNKYAK